MRKSITFWSRLLALFALSVAIFSLAIQPAQAHTRIEIGPYAVVVGWRNEPSVVGERNSLIISVSEDGDLVTGLESTLDAEILYAGRIFRGNLNPVDADGWYSIELIPTIRGQYTLRLVGTIGELDVDELIEPEEILPPNIIAFPEAPPDIFALQATITSLESQLQTMTVVAVAGIVLGGVAIVIALLSFLRRMRRPS